MVTRRTFLQASIAAAAAAGMPWHRFIETAYGDALLVGLSDPTTQPKFTEVVPNALDPGFLFDTSNGKIKVAVNQAIQYTGLLGPGDTPVPVPTTIWGYGAENRGMGQAFYTWPGRTFQVQSGVPLEVKWENDLGNLPLPVTSFGRSVIDKSLHWAYSLHTPQDDYRRYTLEREGVPIVPHVHGGHTDAPYDGNPEYFFSSGFRVRGPRWVDKKYLYRNDQPAGTVWYHDHALGVTRLNVYAGMAGFYIIRDEDDSGLPGNNLSLPTFPYEAALAIQDKMFNEDGGLFYPAWPDDPEYAGFITGEGAVLPPDKFPGGGPTALAEFFGDHFVVNGKIWPKMDVEPRNYRLRLLNGCDSRFLAIRFRQVAAGATSVSNDPLSYDPVVPFTVIGGDQGLASAPKLVNDTLVMETGSRYDIIFNFGSLNLNDGSRIIMENLGGDVPFGGGIIVPGLDNPDNNELQVFPEMRQIMAFDVVKPMDTSILDVSPMGDALTIYGTNRASRFRKNYGDQVPSVTRIRKVALFEGTDEYGRLQPLLGTAEPATDSEGGIVNWPATPVYQQAQLPIRNADGTVTGTPAPLSGPMEGSIAWHSPTTENPALDSTEIWEIYNVTGDAHPIHLHLVHFEVMNREPIDFAVTSVEPQPTVQHNSVGGDPSTYGTGARIVNPKGTGETLPPDPRYVENAPKDMVTALPGEITRIKVTFDKPGRYVWHCHILSHEDHEMMRALYVGTSADAKKDWEDYTLHGGGA